MGLAKRMMEQACEEDSVATRVLIDVGAADECEAHEVASTTYGEVEPAYKFMNWLISRNDPRVAIFGGDRNRAREAITRAHDDLAMECGACAKNAAD